MAGMQVMFVVFILPCLFFKFIYLLLLICHLFGVLKKRFWFVSGVSSLPGII